MRIRIARRWGMMGIGFACAAFLWSGTARAQVKLEYKFPTGQTFKHKTNTKFRQVLTLMGQELENLHDQTMVTSRTVGKRRDDSTIPIEEKVESLRVELAIAGGINVTYDSSEPNAKIDNPAIAFLSEVFKMTGEIVYTVLLDDHNKVKAMEGIEKLQEKADKLSPPARDAIRGELDGDKLKLELEQELRSLPDILTRPGDTWVRTEIVGIGPGQTLTFQKKYEYAGTEKKGDQTLDKITCKASQVEFKQDPAAGGQLKVVKGDLKLESSDETMLFDREKGQVVSLEGKVRVKGDNFTFLINGTELPGGMDLTIETKKELLPAAK